MTRERWEAINTEKARRNHERRKLEAHFNAEIILRHRAGHTKETIISELGISRELFNRVLRGNHSRDRAAQNLHAFRHEEQPAEPLL